MSGNDVRLLGKPVSMAVAGCVTVNQSVPCICTWSASLVISFKLGGFMHANFSDKTSRLRNMLHQITVENTSLRAPPHKLE